MGINPLCHGNEISDLIKQRKAESYYDGARWMAAFLIEHFRKRKNDDICGEILMIKCNYELIGFKNEL